MESMNKIKLELERKTDKEEEDYDIRANAIKTERLWKDGNREGVIRTLVTMMEPLDKALSPVPTSSGRQSPPLSWPETNEFVMVSNKILSGSF